MNVTLLIAALVLLFLGLALVVLEVFIPSGGILGCLAGLSLVTSIVLAFMCGPVVGAGVLAAVIVFVPVLLAAAIHIWPSTPMGKRVLLAIPTSEEVLPDDPERRRLKQLVGCVGQAKSKMLPSGAVVVNGQTVDAVSEGMAIEPGQMVRVVEVRGNRVVVRPAEFDVPAELAGGGLARPIDSVVPDPFEDPLA